MFKIAHQEIKRFDERNIWTGHLKLHYLCPSKWVYPRSTKTQGWHRTHSLYFQMGQKQNYWDNIRPNEIENKTKEKNKILHRVRAPVGFLRVWAVWAGPFCVAACYSCLSYREPRGPNWETARSVSLPARASPSDDTAQLIKNTTLHWSSIHLQRHVPTHAPPVCIQNDSFWAWSFRTVCARYASAVAAVAHLNCHGNWQHLGWSGELVERSPPTPE